MRIAQINATCGAGSTGKICISVSELLSENGVENYIFYSSGSSDYPLGIKYANEIAIKMQTLVSRISGNYGFEARSITERLIKELERISPNIIHIHNIHSHSCNLEILFKYIKEKNIKVYWTLHDCWAFTGYCPHFDMIGCDKWKTECNNCPQSGQFSWFFDRSEYLYDKKKSAIEGTDLTIITPSQWLAGLVKESFFKDYPVKVINNGIDLNVFKPTDSDFRKKHNLENKYMVLGVAFGWGKRKGLDVFCELAKRLDNKRYQIVLVGTNDDVDKLLPKNIISIHRTQNQHELAEIYTAADLFVNPTREENYPTVNMEAIACGTPVVTFNTGGSPEMLDSTCGTVVEKNDIDGIYNEIKRVCETQPYSKDDCLKRAERFDKNLRFTEYLNLLVKHEITEISKGGF